MNNQKTKTMTKDLKEEWGRFVGSQQWHIYGTTTYRNPMSPKANRRLMENTMRRVKDIDMLFFVSEPFSSNASVHSHFLVSTADPQKTLIKLKDHFKAYGKHSIELIESSEEFLNDDGILNVGFYVTKMVSSNIDYDILLKK